MAELSLSVREPPSLRTRLPRVSRCTEPSPTGTMRRHTPQNTLSDAGTIGGGGALPAAHAGSAEGTARGVEGLLGEIGRASGGMEGEGGESNRVNPTKPSARAGLFNASSLFGTIVKMIGASAAHPLS